MGKGLQKSLQVYLSKLRKAMQAELRHHSIPTNAPTSCLLSACKHPRTHSFAAERHQPDHHHGSGGDAPAATLADVDRFLFENFNSLYTSHGADDADGGAAAHENHLGEGCSPPLPTAVDLPPDVCTASTTSSSYSDSSSSSSTATAVCPPQPADAGETAPIVPRNSVAVMTFSKDPYEDFRRSMEEMVEARHVDPRERLDRDFMEELLVAYLELNDRCVHKHILGAFTDLAVALQRRSAPIPGGRTSKGRERGRTAGFGRVRQSDVTSSGRRLTWNASTDARWAPQQRVDPGRRSPASPLS